ncbi:MAG TPA: hypothetical protein VE890_02015, partial [Thermoguttaceae bacterium]|nr:hypothetical protein [Thermoguttaceae bacterium]
MSSLPDYLAAAKPVPMSDRAPWYKNTAQTYAGIMLWVVFWRYIVIKTPVFGGSLSAGIGVALVSVLVAALLCHFLTYVVPAMLGMKTGLPLYVVGTSTYGASGGFIMPGFLMGALQFGWLAVNACIACSLICESFGVGVDELGRADFGSPIYWVLGAIYVVLAVGVGLKGIQYVAKVATFMPLIPLVILLILLAKTASGIGSFEDNRESMIAANQAAVEKAAAEAPEAEKAEPEGNAAANDEADEPAAEAGAADPNKQEYLKGLFSVSKDSGLFVFLFLSTYIVGFFATAGAAGADFGMNNRNASDV